MQMYSAYVYVNLFCWHNTRCFLLLLFFIIVVWNESSIINLHAIFFNANIYVHIYKHMCIIICIVSDTRNGCHNLKYDHD